MPDRPPGEAPPTRPWILYGAYGYTGELVAREALARGLAPVLAGRDAAALSRLGAELGLPTRAFALDSPAALAAGLDGAAAVLSCAGPFVRTSRGLVAACLRNGVHYLDITGEIAVFEAVLRRGAEARQAGICLLPGVGFDVVPSDCLAARLAAALPGAVDLELAFATAGGSWSRGTLKTVLEGLPHAGAVRKGGRIVPVPLAWEAKEIPFADRTRWAMTIPWGDVATAFHSTGIPNIRVYTAVPRAQIARLRRLRALLPLLGTRPLKRLLQAWVARAVTGPDESVRAAARMHLWGRAAGAGGAAVSATLETSEGYRLTARAAVEAMRRVLAGAVQPGAWTPSRAFGAGFVEELPDVLAGPIVSVQGG